MYVRVFNCSSPPSNKRFSLSGWGAEKRERNGLVRVTAVDKVREENLRQIVWNKQRRCVTTD